MVTKVSPLPKYEMKKLLCHVFSPWVSEPTETGEHSDGPHVHSGQVACLSPMHPLPSITIEVT